MMNCEQVRTGLALLTRVRDERDLPTALLAHAATCAGCRRAIGQRVAQDEVLEHHAEIEVPPGFEAATVRLALDTSAESLVESTAEPMAKTMAKAVGTRRLSPLAAAALLFVGVSLGLTAWHWTGQSAALEPPDPELLARLDLLMDWDLLVEHAQDIELVDAAELVDVLSDLDDSEDGAEGGSR